MIRCIIVDDENKNREGLKNILLTLQGEVDVIATCASVDEAELAILEHEPDLVFLDVELEGETGFDLLSRFESISFNIIFVSAHSGYALRAIKVSAIDFLLKPIHIEDLEEALARIRRQHVPQVAAQVEELLHHARLGGKENTKLALPTSEGLTFISISDIMYCKASGNYTEIFMTGNKKFLISRKLKEYEEILAEYKFFRVHHSYLINLDYVFSYKKGEGGHVVMSDNTSIDVSRRKKESFLERIGYRY